MRLEKAELRYSLVFFCAARIARISCASRQSELMIRSFFVVVGLVVVVVAAMPLLPDDRWTDGHWQLKT